MRWATTWRTPGWVTTTRWRRTSGRITSWRAWWWTWNSSRTTWCAWTMTFYWWRTTAMRTAASYRTGVTRTCCSASCISSIATSMATSGTYSFTLNSVISWRLCIMIRSSGSNCPVCSYPAGSCCRCLSSGTNIMCISSGSTSSINSTGMCVSDSSAGFNISTNTISRCISSGSIYSTGTSITYRSISSAGSTCG